VSFTESRERRLDLLADLVEEHLDLDALHDLAVSDPPRGLPVLPPGADR
jgi:adenosylcobyric acid synthase